MWNCSGLLMNLWVMETIQKSINSHLFPPIIVLTFLWWRVMQVKGKYEFGSLAFRTRKYLYLCTQRHSPVRQKLVLLDSEQSKAFSQYNSPSSHRCLLFHYTNTAIRTGNTVAVFLCGFIANTEATLLQVISCDTCFTVKQVIKKNISLVVCLRKCLPPYSTLLKCPFGAVSTWPSKTKDHFTHKKISMLHDRANKVKLEWPKGLVCPPLKILLNWCWAVQVQRKHARLLHLLQVRAPYEGRNGIHWPVKWCLEKVIFLLRSLNLCHAHFMSVRPVEIWFRIQTQGDWANYE